MSLAYNEAFGIAAHNSYWINRSDKADFGASGTQELIADQLLHDHVRGIEIDIHSEGASAGQWKVYHTSDSEDFLGRHLEDYLEYLRNFHYAIPKHEVINIVIELKNVVSETGVYDVTTVVHHNWQTDHTIQEFDDTFRRYLGAWLYTPADFLARSPSPSMRACAADAGWPSIEELRGHFMINILGNWSTAAYDWVEYATSDLSNRVCFPMQSVFEIQPEDYEPAESRFLNTRQWFKAQTLNASLWIRDISEDVNPCPDIPDDARQAAFDASVFWQFEDVANPFAMARAGDFLTAGGVIRCHDSFEYQVQCLAVMSGFQLVQTDYPWHVINDEAAPGLGIPTDPSHRLRSGSWHRGPDCLGSSRVPRVTGAIREPGSRFYLHTTPPAEIWAYTYVPSVAQRWWEVTVSTTRMGDTAGLSYPRRAQDYGAGSIRVHSRDGRNSVVIVRHKENPGNPLDNYFQEKVMIGVIVVRDGVEVDNLDLAAARYGPCKDASDPNSSDVSPICIGSLIALSIDGSHDGAFVRAFSAGKTTADEAVPDWQWLGEWAFGQPMIWHGFSGFGDLLFAGPRTADSIDAEWRTTAPLQFVALSDLPEREVFKGPAPDARVVDLSS